MKDKIFGRIVENQNVALFFAEDGEAVATIDENIYPVGSELSCRYEHPNGIIITRSDGDKLDIDIEA